MVFTIFTFLAEAFSFYGKLPVSEKYVKKCRGRDRFSKSGAYCLSYVYKLGFFTSIFT